MPPKPKKRAAVLPEFDAVAYVQAHEEKLVRRLVEIAETSEDDEAAALAAIGALEIGRRRTPSIH